MSKPKFFDLPVELQARMLSERSIHAEMFKKWADGRDSRMESRMVVDGQEGAGDNEILMDGVIDRHSEMGFYRKWMGDESAISPRLFRERLQEIEGDPVIRMDSPGGDVKAGLAIVQYIQEYDGPITCMVDSYAASVASVIMAACDKVIAGKGAEVMIHKAWAMAVGDDHDFRKMAEVLSKQNMLAIGVYRDRMDKNDDEILALMADETYFNGEEAVEIGLIDEIYKPKKNKGKGGDMSAKMKDSANNHLVQQIAVLSAA